MHPPYRAERQAAAEMALCGCSQQQIRNMLTRERGASWYEADCLATEAVRIDTARRTAEATRGAVA